MRPSEEVRHETVSLTALGFGSDRSLLLSICTLFSDEQIDRWDWLRTI